MNTISLVGNLTKDPRLISKKKQTPRAIFTIAINERYGKDGENEVTHFAQCTAFGDLAEHIAGSLSKGDRVVAAARLNTYSKEVEIDGEDVDLTMTAFTVTAIGPELRFAEAEVTRISKDDDEEDEVSKKSTSKKSRKAAEPDDDEDGEDDEEEAPKKSRVKSKAKKKAKEDDEDEDDEF